MVRLRNDTDNDLYKFGLHFAAGTTNDVTTLDHEPELLAWLKRNLTEVEETATVSTPTAVKAEPVPVPEADVEVEAPTVKKRRSPYRRRG